MSQALLDLDSHLPTRKAPRDSVAAAAIAVTSGIFVKAEELTTLEVDFGLA